MSSQLLYVDNVNEMSIFKDGEVIWCRKVVKFPNF